MSKSYGNTIGPFDQGKTLKKKIGGIVTDSTPLEDPKDPDSDNVFALIKLFASSEEQADVAAWYRAGGFGYGHAKKELTRLMDAYFGDARERRRTLSQRPDDVRDVLADGARKARARSEPIMARVREVCGLVRTH